MSNWRKDIQKTGEWDIETRKSWIIKWGPGPNDSVGRHFDSTILVFGPLKFEYYFNDENSSANCQECGMVHEPEAPHFPFGTYFEGFTKVHNRFPHWSDVTEHCPPKIRAALKDFLDLQGKWSEPKEALPQEEFVARELGALPIHSQKIDPKAQVFTLMTDMDAKLEEVGNPFVGQPNDEKTRAQIAEAMEQVLGRNTRVNAKAVGDKVELDITLMPEMAADRVEIVYREEKDDEDEEGQSDGNP